MIHSELIFMMSIKSRSRFIFFKHVNIQLLQHHLLKKLSLLQCITFFLLSNISWSYLLGCGADSGVYLWTLICSFICLLFVVVQSPSSVQFFATSWTGACQAYLSLTISWSLPKFMLLNRWCHPTISSSVSLFSFSHWSFPASRSSSNELAVYFRWPKYWSFSINPSKE